MEVGGNTLIYILRRKKGTIWVHNYIFIINEWETDPHFHMHLLHLNFIQQHEKFSNSFLCFHIYIYILINVTSQYNICYLTTFILQPRPHSNVIQHTLLQLHLSYVLIIWSHSYPIVMLATLRF